MLALPGPDTRIARNVDLHSQEEMAQTEHTLNGQPPGELSHHGMVLIPGGTFRMGSDRHYPEEAPAHRVTVPPFWIDRTPVTNREFRRFVNATAYVTVAEVAPDPKDYPGALPNMLKPGSLVFTPPRHLWTFMIGHSGGGSNSGRTGDVRSAAVDQITALKIIL